MTFLYFNHIQMIEMIIGTFISMIPLVIFIYFDKKDDGAWTGLTFGKILKLLKRGKNEKP